tara:strand:+ start:1672 stop:2277 length:606 start_codon:yes stop_codon:yes gene_type:complete
MSDFLAKSFVPLEYNFYLRSTRIVAQEILGKFIVRSLKNKFLIGKIVEVEAYEGSNDPGSHAYGNVTARNYIMYGPPGFSYVYFIYGIHYCLNIVTEKIGIPGAILVRALEPIHGSDIMKQNRNTSRLTNLTNGPAKLTQALNITSNHNNLNLTCDDELYICRSINKENFNIANDFRIGVKKENNKPWRYFIESNPFVSVV